MSSTVDRVDRSRYISAWSGTENQLRSAMAAFDDHIKRYREPLLNSPVATDALFDWTGREAQYYKALASWGTNADLWLRERATGDITNRHGAFESLFQDVGDREIVAAQIQYQNESEFGIRDIGHGALTFAKGSGVWGSPGVTLTVNKSSPTWSAQLVDAVCRELGECIPWWHRLRTAPGRWFVIIVATVLLFGISFFLLEAVDPWFRLGFAIIASGIGGLLLLRRKIFNYLLPAFEVIKSGAVGTGSRNLGFMGSSVFLVLLLGVLVNRVS